MQHLVARVVARVRRVVRVPATTPRTAERPRARLPTFRGRGVRPGVNLDSAASLLDAMEGSIED